MVSLSIAQALAQAVEQLSATSVSAKVDAQLLLCSVIGKNTTYLFTWPEKILEPEQMTAFSTLLERRKVGEPVAYLTGKRGFWSLNLKTNNSTLIPRADTESLVEYAIETLSTEQAKMLDLGTGTGAIALALASEFEYWHIYACDYNADAVELANSNAAQLAQRKGDLIIVQSDWFSAYEQHHQGSFDLIVSNPPYIDSNDEHLSQGDLVFEPNSALVAENEGFADIFHIIEQARRFLKPAGWLMIEHGFEQGERVRQYFERYGYQDVMTKKDLADNDRFTVGCLARSIKSSANSVVGT